MATAKRRQEEVEGVVGAETEDGCSDGETSEAGSAGGGGGGGAGETAAKRLRRELLEQQYAAGPWALTRQGEEEAWPGVPPSPRGRFAASTPPRGGQKAASPAMPPHHYLLQQQHHHHSGSSLL